MQIYTTKVREEATNPTRQVNDTHFEVSRNDSDTPDRQVNLAICDDSGAYSTKREQQIPASSARRILSSSTSLAPSTFVETPGTSTEVNGPKYRNCNLHKFFQSNGNTQNHQIEVVTCNRANRGALIDRGANGSGGCDVRI